jgi:AmpE protein
MNFLIVLAAVVMVHQEEWIRHIQRDEWFEAWQQRFAQAGAMRRWLPLVMVAAPVLVLVLVLYMLADYWWLLFIVNALVLLYSIGRGSWRTECDTWVKVFSEGDLPTLKEHFAEQHIEVADVPDGSVEVMWLRARSTVLYHQLDSFYTVVFWFFLLGAPMALMYRLLHLCHQQGATTHDLKAEGRPMTEAELFLWLMEWIPVRLMGLLFCLVGNFTTGFWVLKQIVRDGELSSTDALVRSADAALFLDGSTDDDELASTSPATRTARMIERMEEQSAGQKTLAMMRRYSVELQALLHRSEWAFLVLIALTALV